MTDFAAVANSAVPPEIWILGLLVALMTAAAVLYSGVVEKRNREFEEAAKTLNFEYLGAPAEGLPKEIAKFALFGKTNPEHVEHAMRGEANEIEVTVFQLSGASGAGMNIKVESQTVACFRTDGMDLPWLFVRPNVLEKRPAPRGMQELGLPGGFAERYSVCAARPERVKRMFTQQVMDQISMSAGLVCAEGEGHFLVVYYPGRPFRLRDAPQFLQDAFRVFSIVKQASAALPPEESEQEDGASGAGSSGV